MIYEHSQRRLSKNQGQLGREQGAGEVDAVMNLPLLIITPRNVSVKIDRLPFTLKKKHCFFFPATRTQLIYESTEVWEKEIFFSFHLG